MCTVVVRCTVGISVDGSHKEHASPDGEEEGERSHKDEHGKRDGQSRAEPLPVLKMSALRERERRRIEGEKGRGDGGGERERGEGGE